MNGFQAFKYYTALKLHFTSSSFDVFVNKGRVKGSLDKFKMRNDHMLFERLARLYPNDKDCIQYLASNFMYNNPNVIYNADEGITNYKEFLRRRESMTHIFSNDLDNILHSGAQLEISGSKIPDVIQLMMSNKITIETVVILNDLEGFIDKIQDNNHISLLLGDDLMRIQKSKRFVKYDSYKVMSPYLDFLEELKGTVNG